RREAECVVDAPALTHCAHAGAAAKMSYDDSAAGDLRRDLGQRRGDILVRQTMKTVSPQAAATELRWKRDKFGDFRVGRVKGGVETCDLGNLGEAFENGFDRCQVIGLV